MKKIFSVLLLSVFNITVLAAQCPSGDHFIHLPDKSWTLDSESSREGWKILSTSKSEGPLNNAYMQVDLWVTTSHAVCEYITGYDSAVVVSNYNKIDTSKIPRPPFQEVKSPDWLDYFCRTWGSETQKCKWG